MRKKIAAMLLVGAVAAVGTVGLTSCGISVNSGSEVGSEAEWKQAFENSLNAENYTLDYFVLLESSVSSSGTILILLVICKSSNRFSTIPFTVKKSVLTEFCHFEF